MLNFEHEYTTAHILNSLIFNIGIVSARVAVCFIPADPCNFSFYRQCRSTVEINIWPEKHASTSPAIHHRYHNHIVGYLCLTGYIY